MPGLQGADGIHALQPAFKSLSGQAVDQVQGQVVGAVLTAQGRRLPGFRKVMDTADAPELAVIGGLNAHGDPVDPGFFQLFEQGLVGALWVDLHGDLAVPGEVCPLAQLLQQFGDALALEHRRRAAADIHGIHGILSTGQEEIIQLAEERLQIGVHQLVIPLGGGAEIAVGTFAAAERDMKINAQIAAHFIPHPGAGPP